MDVDLEACINGDKGAWDAFVERWAGVIHASVRRACKGHGGAGARTDIEDAVQDVFVRLLKDECRLLRTFDADRASLATWLALVARSTAIDRLRRRRPPAVAIRADDVVAEAPAAAAVGPEIPLHVLTGRQRLVLRLLFDEGRSVAEAAGLIGVDEQTVRSTKHKALTRLRQTLGGPESGDEPAAGPVQPGSKEP